MVFRLGFLAAARYACTGRRPDVWICVFVQVCADVRATAVAVAGDVDFAK